MTLPRNLDDALEAQILELLADEQYQGHPLRLALEELWEAMNSQLDRLERITELSDRYQKAARENTLHLAKRYDRQIRLLERVLRISDRYQSMLKDLNVALREASTHDLLTGIANRRLMMDCCRQADLQFAKQGIPYSMVVIDADHFNLINDTYGHDFGDRMLVELARVFRENLRSTDVCSRWGGEEFLGLMNQASLAEAERIVERLLESVRSSSIPYEQEMVKPMRTPSVVLMRLSLWPSGAGATATSSPRLPVRPVAAGTYPNRNRLGLPPAVRRRHNEPAPRRNSPAGGA